jgi:anti-sigma B factor antagonist
MKPLNIAVAAGDRGPVLTLSGESDISVVAELAAALAVQVDAAPRHLTVDLSGLTFADSATISALIEASRALRARGGTLELARPRPVVARTLELLGVNEVLQVRGEAGATLTGDGEPSA